MALVTEDDNAEEVIAKETAVLKLVTISAGQKEVSLGRKFQT